MSTLIFPFLFKHDYLNRHEVKIILPFLEQKKFFTGTRTGEIIAWTQKGSKFIPSLFLLPCLNQNIGSVTALSIIKMVEPELTVSRILINNFKITSEFCLLSSHADNRIRIWDINDGRCISISNHNMFPSEEVIREIKPLSTNRKRFVLCLGIFLVL